MGSPEEEPAEALARSGGLMERLLLRGMDLLDGLELAPNEVAGEDLGSRYPAGLRPDAHLC